LLRSRGVESHLVNPHHLRIDRGKLVIHAGPETLPLSLVVRFHQVWRNAAHETKPADISSTDLR
jgi:hypothetical protein